MSSSEKGFTLIEMLVAMAIFASLIVVLMMGYRQGLMMWDKGQHVSREWLDMEFRYRLLDRLFAQAAAANDTISIDQVAPYFIADGLNLKLLSAAPIMDNVGRIKPVQLQLLKQQNSLMALRYQEGMLYSDQRRGIRWSDQWVVLLDGLTDASFAYEAPENPMPDELAHLNLNEQELKMYRDQPEWLALYDAHDLLLYPRRIAFQFTDANNEKHRWLFRPPDMADAWTMEE
ncbi:prepilin-type N-terminal cleavage/methylation domain-containing protein [Mariprofundus ferrooxydans]|nr:prepilin-type N-terminal cleavage/methylation domain-containing protein [Mariprofundus ferrooxydans]MBN4077140.1 prepilin-type N-terminal cleavage/methylation domain-containing protein [Mariprofundus ferrooxydans]